MLHGRMEQVEERLRRRGSVGRAAWAVIRCRSRQALSLRAHTACPARARSRRVISTEIDHLLGRFRLLSRGSCVPRSGRGPRPAHANVFQREVGRRVALSPARRASRGRRPALRKRSMDVEVNRPGRPWPLAGGARAAMVGDRPGPRRGLSAPRDEAFGHSTHVWEGNSAMFAVGASWLGGQRVHRRPDLLDSGPRAWCASPRRTVARRTARLRRMPPFTCSAAARPGSAEGRRREARPTGHGSRRTSAVRGAPADRRPARRA